MTLEQYVRDQLASRGYSQSVINDTLIVVDVLPHLAAMKGRMNHDVSNYPPQLMTTLLFSLIHEADDIVAREQVS